MIFILGLFLFFLNAYAYRDADRLEFKASFVLGACVGLLMMAVSVFVFILKHLM